MIVWVVMDEFESVEGVFDSIDKAKEYVNKHPNRTHIESSIGLKLNIGRVV